MKLILAAFSILAVACGGSPSDKAAQTNLLNPDFVGTWKGLRTISEPRSSVSDPNWQVDIVETVNGFAQATCDDQPLLIDGEGNRAVSTGMIKCTWPVPYPTCPRVEIHSATLELKANSHLSIVEAYDLVPCEGDRNPMRWEFDGVKGEVPVVVGQGSGRRE